MNACTVGFQKDLHGNLSHENYVWYLGNCRRASPYVFVQQNRRSKPPRKKWWILICSTSNAHVASSVRSGTSKISWSRPEVVETDQGIKVVVDSKAVWCPSTACWSHGYSADLPNRKGLWWAYSSPITANKGLFIMYHYIPINWLGGGFWTPMIFTGLSSALLALAASWCFIAKL